MNAETLLQSKRKDILRIAARHGAYNVRIFGSVARGEARFDSDIDFLVNLEENRSLLDCKVNVVTEAGLRPRIHPQVLKDARPL